MPALSAAAAAIDANAMAAPAPAPSPVPSTSSSSSSAPVKVYRPLNGPAPALPEVNDADFEPTGGELHAAFAGQVRKREKLVDGPLLTRKLRDEAAAKDMAARRARFPTVRPDLALSVG